MNTFTFIRQWQAEIRHNNQTDIFCSFPTSWITFSALYDNSVNCVIMFYEYAKIYENMRE